MLATLTDLEKKLISKCYLKLAMCNYRPRLSYTRPIFKWLTQRAGELFKFNHTYSGLLAFT